MPSNSELPPPMPPGVSRRDFARFLSLMAAGLVIPRGSAEALLARDALGEIPPASAIRLNSNENPLGPSRAALEAIQRLGAEGGRYPWEAESALCRRIAEFEGIPETCVEVFNGSSDPLNRAVLAFTGPGRPFVYGEPGYEAGRRAAKVSGAEAIAIALTDSLAHDAGAMCAANQTPGLLYICSPNNPTGTTTTRDQILWALANKPANSLLLVDEAYLHFSNERSVADQIATHADLLVLRTFSKLYGMAGLRMGLALAQPPVLDRLRAFGMSSTSAPGIAAARASLDDAGLIATRRAYNAEAREATFAFLTQRGYTFHPSVSNCFMLDAERPAAELAKALRQRGVLIGRTWPVWPNYARITIGTPEEMQQFCRALDAVRI